MCCSAYLVHCYTNPGILLFDEYGYPSTHGQKRAVDECLADKPERPIVFHTGQALVIKVSSV